MNEERNSVVREEGILLQNLHLSLSTMLLSILLVYGKCRHLEGAMIDSSKNFLQKARVIQQNVCGWYFIKTVNIVSETGSREIITTQSIGMGLQ